MAHLKQSTIKKRYVGANQASFINSKIHKELMRRSCLRNKFLDSKTDAYNKHRNQFVILIQEKKRPIAVILKYVTDRII